MIYLKMLILIIFVILFEPMIVNAQAVNNEIKDACTNSATNSSLCADFQANVDPASDPVSKLAKTITDIFAFFAGIIALIYLIFGGFKYVKSAGNAEKAASGRQTIIYALVGIIIIIVAQQLVLFIISKL